MPAGAEGHTRIQADHQFPGLCRVILPAGLDHKAAHRHGMEVLLPALRPGLVWRQGTAHCQAAGVIIRCCLQISDRLLRPRRLRLLLKPGLHQRVLRHPAQDLLIHQRPGGPKRLRPRHVRPVDHLGAQGPGIHHQRRHRFRPQARGLHRHLHPVHPALQKKNLAVLYRQAHRLTNSGLSRDRGSRRGDHGRSAGCGGSPCRLASGKTAARQGG